MTKAEEFFHKLTEEIPDVTSGKMFGAFCMKTSSGKSAAMFWKENIVVKLQGDAMKEAKSLEGTSLFEPMEGRTMKEWIQIPFIYKDQWKKFAVASASSVLSPKKIASSKRK